MVWGQPSQPQPPQTCVLPAWGHPKNPQQLNRVVMKRKTKPKKHTKTHENPCFQPTRWFFCLLSFPAQQALPDWLTAAQRKPGFSAEAALQGRPMARACIVSILPDALLMRQLTVLAWTRCTGWEALRKPQLQHHSSHRLHRASHRPPHLLPLQEQVHISNHHAREETQWPLERADLFNLSPGRQLQLILSAGMGAEKCLPLPQS